MRRQVNNRLRVKRSLIFLSQLSAPSSFLCKEKYKIRKGNKTAKAKERFDYLKKKNEDATTKMWYRSSTGKKNESNDRYIAIYIAQKTRKMYRIHNTNLHN